MPRVIDPSKLTYLIETPAGPMAVTSAVGNALNDLFRAWGAVDRQMGYVLPRRLARATFYRARYDDAIRL